MHAAAPLKSLFVSNEEPPPVWPDPAGEVLGESFRPLNKAVPVAVKKDDKLYKMLALVDAIRGGRSREKEAANKKSGKGLQRMKRPQNPNLRILALAADQPGEFANEMVFISVAQRAC